jgi:hypothetical protein
VQVASGAIGPLVIPVNDRIDLDFGDFPLAAPCDISVGAEGNTIRNSVQPATERLINPERVSPANQDEKRGLKGILRVTRVAKHTSAD